MAVFKREKLGQVMSLTCQEESSTDYNYDKYCIGVTYPEVWSECREFLMRLNKSGFMAGLHNGAAEWNQWCEGELTSRTLIFDLAEDSKKAQWFHCLARFWPCSFPTTRSSSRSHLFPTRIIGTWGGGKQGNTRSEHMAAQHGRPHCIGSFSALKQSCIQTSVLELGDKLNDRIPNNIYIYSRYTG